MCDWFCVTRHHQDLELLASRWSIESYAFIAVRREFTPTLKDVARFHYVALVWKCQCDGDCSQGRRSNKVELSHRYYGRLEVIKKVHLSAWMSCF